MATGHSVVVLNDKFFNAGFVDYLANEDVFALKTLPHGRFPTLSELRRCLHELGYDVKEAQDWYVTSEDDFTEIWFRDDTPKEDQPAEFWFRRGHHIVLHLSQKIANCCGSLVVFDHSGTYPPLLFVPDAVFPNVAPSRDTDDFFTVFSRRLPSIVEQLAKASDERALFLLSQIRSALGWADRLRQGDLFQIAQQSLPTFAGLLKSTEPRIRFLAFDLIVTFPERFSEQANALRSAMQSESDDETKARMVASVTRFFVQERAAPNLLPWEKAIVEVALEMVNAPDTYPPVRFAATHLLVHAQPGSPTPAMREILIDALRAPERYVLARRAAKSIAAHSVVLHALETIQKLLLFSHRLAILSAALPQMAVAQDAHEVMRALLDNSFFGTTLPAARASLPEDRVAERPEMDASKFRDGLPQSWLYFANPTQLTVEDLLPFQRSILEAVMDLTVPWMVHSNLLEKYGLPPTRAGVRERLKNRL